MCDIHVPAVLCVQVVLSDLQDLQTTWGQDEQQQDAAAAADELTPEEAALVQQLTSSEPLMPDDFTRCAWGPEEAGDMLVGLRFP